jgi:hypothetical protein
VYGSGTAVFNDGGWVYRDKTGADIIRPYTFDNGPDYFVEGMARFQRGGKMGFFDVQGNIIIPPAYDFAAPFCGGYSIVCNGCTYVPDEVHRHLEGGVWGHIDLTGKVVTPFEYDMDSLPEISTCELR